MGKMTMDENSINLAKAIISDIIDEVAITKGAMILDGYDEEDSCIHYMNGLVKELSDFNLILKKSPSFRWGMNCFHRKYTIIFQITYFKFTFY